jgi:hypothetical protein
LTVVLAAAIIPGMCLFERQFFDLRALIDQIRLLVAR